MWCGGAPTPYDPVSGKPLAAARAVPADARRSVCGIPGSLTRLAAGHLLPTGTHSFRTHLSPMMYPTWNYTRGRTASAIVARCVTDMDSGACGCAASGVRGGPSGPWPMRRATRPPLQTTPPPSAFVQARGADAGV